MNVCIIPARGGSKRIPRKNIKNFHGRPMISWSISRAIESNLFNRIIVSTDDEEIAAIARSEGVEVPFLRPNHLSDDHTTTACVISHAISSLQGLSSDTNICCLYATAAFTTSSDLIQGLETLKKTLAPFVFPITSFPYPVQRALRRMEDQSVEMINPGLLLTRTQDLEEAWHDAGQFYWAQASSWLAELPVFGNGAVGIPIPRRRAQDIDTIDDWVHAETLFEAMDRDNSWQ